MTYNNAEGKFLCPTLARLSQPLKGRPQVILRKIQVGEEFTQCSQTSVCKRPLRIHMIREDLDTFCKESSSYAFDPQLGLRIHNWLQIIEKEPFAKGQTYCTGFGLIQNKKSEFSNSVKEQICSPCNECTFN